MAKKTTNKKDKDIIRQIESVKALLKNMSVNLDSKFIRDNMADFTKKVNAITIFVNSVVPEECTIDPLLERIHQKMLDYEFIIPNNSKELLGATCRALGFIELCRESESCMRNDGPFDKRLNNIVGDIYASLMDDCMMTVIPLLLTNIYVDQDQN